LTAKKDIPKPKVQKAADEEPIATPIGEKIEPAKAVPKARKEKSAPRPAQTTTQIILSHNSRLVVIPAAVAKAMGFQNHDKLTFAISEDNRSLTLTKTG
jgi:hypothetical protein